MSAFTIVRRFAGLEEARVAWALLRSAGIEAQLWHHEACSNLVWGSASGADLVVPSGDAEDARAALAEAGRSDGAVPAASPLGRGWATRDIAALAAVALLLTVPRPLGALRA